MTGDLQIDGCVSIGQFLSINPFYTFHEPLFSFQCLNNGCDGLNETSFEQDIAFKNLESLKVETKYEGLLRRYQ